MYADKGPRHWQVFYDTLDKLPAAPIPAPPQQAAVETALLKNVLGAVTGSESPESHGRWLAWTRTSTRHWRLAHDHDHPQDDARDHSNGLEPSFHSTQPAGRKSRRASVPHGHPDSF